jgi:hypothetical protein
VTDQIQPTQPSSAALLLPMRGTLRVCGLLFAVALPIAALVGWLVAGSEGLWGAVIGLAVPAVFFGITVVTALVTAQASPGAFGAIVLGAWLLKIIAMGAVLIVLQGQDFWSRGAFSLAFAVGVVGWLAAEAAVVVRTRTPYVEPR